MKNAIGQSRRQQNAGAGDEPARPSETTMRRHEIRSCDAVAVQEKDVGAGTDANAAIKDIGLPETPIFMPNMLDREVRFRRPFAHHLGRRRAGAIVGDHDFEIAIGLTRQCAQYRIESFLPIVGRHDH